MVKNGESDLFKCKNGLDLFKNCFDKHKLLPLAIQFKDS